MTLSVVAIVEFDEAQQGPVLDLISGVAQQVRAEDGCERYDVFTSGRRRVVFLEEWRDGAALERHAAAEAFAELLAGLEALGLPAPTVHLLRPTAV